MSAKWSIITFNVGLLLSNDSQDFGAWTKMFQIDF